IRALGSAAAILLVSFGIFMHIDKTNIEKPVQLVKVRDSKHQEVKGSWGINEDVSITSLKVLSKEKGSTVAINTVQEADNSKIAHSHNRPGQDAISREVIEFELAAPDLSAFILKAETNPIMPDSMLIAKTTLTNEKASLANHKASFKDFLDTEDKLTDQVGKEPGTGEKNNKLNLGLVVSPSYGNTKDLKMGYGVSMAFALSDKVALSSGISINEMAASKEFVQPATMTSLNGKVLESAESNVTGIDIPFDIKYHFSKNVYTSFGVSAFAVLDQSGKNTFTEAKLVERSFSTAEGKQETRTFVENQKTIEEVPEADLENRKYFGLYNFSFGFKQKVSKKKVLSIEPFVKVPIKETKKEGLRLFGTGLRFKLEI
ncbi:MAG TPA: hypothetical protein VLZ28_05685, partial [Daejeonella sp.]|nr:hypothetical protein [Daejeonella sp.]